MSSFSTSWLTGFRDQREREKGSQRERERKKERELKSVKMSLTKFAVSNCLLKLAAQREKEEKRGVGQYLWVILEKGKKRTGGEK
jgi:hypothetical protein